MSGYYLILLLYLLSIFYRSVQPLTVKCPPFDSSDMKPWRSIRESYNDYCKCQLHISRGGITAIIKCDFNYEKDIILDEELFDFKENNCTSAYVRMTNCKSASIKSKFIYKWMEAPSSAIDLWSCGKVDIESAEEPVGFSDIQTFIGAGIVNCSLEKLPSYFLRDRTRAALRFRQCRIDNIHQGLFHNISEVRYFILEDSYVKSVQGPLATSGVIQLSRKSMHSWDGLEIINSTIDYIAPMSFNIEHTSDMEDLKVENNVLGNLSKHSFIVIGDIKVDIANNTIKQMDSRAFKISVTGVLTFEKNKILNLKDEGFTDIQCSNNNTLNKNVVYLTNEHKNLSNFFNTKCGTPKVEFIKEVMEHSNTITIVFLFLGAIGVIIAVAVYYRKVNAVTYKTHPKDGLLDEEFQSHDQEAAKKAYNPSFTSLLSKCRLKL